MTKDYYRLLGVDVDASTAEIKRAFRWWAHHVHPDRNPHPGASQRFRDVTEAYRVLGDPESRAAYDQERVAYDQERAAAHRRRPFGALHLGVHLGILDLSLALGTPDEEDPESGQHRGDRDRRQCQQHDRCANRS